MSTGPVAVADAAAGAGPDAHASEERSSLEDAGPPRGACVEPMRIVQRGTVNEAAHFEGDVLVGEEHAYDPETLTPRAKPKTPSEPRKTGRYAEAAGGVGIVRGPDWPFPESVTLEDTATRKILRIVPTCAAAGGPPPSFALSNTGRFFICRASRTHDYLFATRRNGQRDPMLSEGPNDVSLSSNDRYAISVPVRSWLTLEPTQTKVLYFDLDAHTSKAIASANPKVPTNLWDIDKNPFGISFCGDGKLFAISLDREIAIYRGADGARLASASSPEGRGTSFDAAGRYVSQTRGDGRAGWATSVFRLE